MQQIGISDLFRKIVHTVLPVLFLITTGPDCLFSRLHAQTGVASPFSNIRTRAILTATDSIHIDSLSVVSGSFIVEDVPDSHYHFYPEKALLIWRQKPATDSVWIRYRALPFSFHKRYRHKTSSLIDSGRVSMIYQHKDRGSGSIMDFNQLEYNGSYGRSIAMGNNQDVVLNSSFNLQINGYILDSIKLEAALTDNTIPFQPEGNTQRLQEFDQIYIRLTKNKHFLQLGDYNLDAPPGYFLKFFKRVQGAYYQTEFNLGKHAVNKAGISGSIAKGQFARNIFPGLEGNQGPYKLTGNNGEQFFIVLAGTERVYVDNVLMERGENADYTMNYNTGEIRFMPRRMITRDSRIQVEYEYQDRNYLNSLIYAWDELSIGDKWKVRLDAYSNQDAKNQPYLQQLSGDQKRFLSTIGDSVHQAFYPSMIIDTFAAGKILYRMTDTVVNGLLYDSIFVYSTQPADTQFALAFSYVGENRGHYIISSGSANGRVYDWVAPVDGVPQGSFAPVQLLVTPKKQQLFILTTDYQIDSLRKLSIETGVSNTDPNLFSNKDNHTHWGMATKIAYQEKRFTGKKDSNGNRRWAWENNISYEYVQDKFQAIAPYRNVEFGRDWNVPATGRKPDEHLVYAGTKAGHERIGTAGYQFSWYRRGTAYNGLKQILTYDYNRNKIRAGLAGNLLTATDTFQRSLFLRPVIYAEYKLSGLMNTFIGSRYEAEHNELRSKKTDSLLPTAFSFDILSAYIRTSTQQPAQWQLTYFTRSDRTPVENSFRQNSRSHNAELKLAFSQWKHHNIGLTSTYRRLIRYDTVATGKEEETLLGRMEYSGSIIRQAVTLNSLYEFGSGQEQKQSYTYVEVPAGQGVYTWVDYNGDGIQQANEFEVALYPDQKKFIRIFSPTNEYVKVNYVNFNFSLLLDPANIWVQKEKKKWQRFVSRFSSQSSLQIANRLLASEGLKAYNPFVSVQQDTAIIITNNALSNSIFFNRSNTRWGIDYNLSYHAGRQLLIYGIEANRQVQHLYKIRWNIIRPLTLHLAARNGNRSYQSGIQDNRTYYVESQALDPSITWLHRSILRITSGYRYEARQNRPAYGGEKATIQTASLELRYSQPAAGVIQLRGSYAAITYHGDMTKPVAFTMLDALQQGNNYLWYINWERKIGKGIELSLEYEGRKPGTGVVIHTGRMSIRAIL